MSTVDWYPDDPDTCLALADTVVVAHFAIVIFVIAGEALVLLGKALRWRWVGNRWFRGAHLLVIAFIAIQAVLGEACPLTIWENGLRIRAGKPIEQASFIAYWLHELLFVDADLALLAACYVGFALLVVASLFLAPVRWKRSEVRDGGARDFEIENRPLNLLFSS